MLASSNTSKGPLSNRHRISFTSSRFSTASAIQQSLSSELSKCSSDIYVIAQQPGVSLIDYSEVVSTPHLKEWMSSNKRVKSKGHVAEVKGHVEPSALVEQLQRKCGAELLAIDASSEYDYHSKVIGTDITSWVFRCCGRQFQQAAGRHH